MPIIICNEFLLFGQKVNFTILTKEMFDNHYSVKYSVQHASEIIIKIPTK